MRINALQGMRTRAGLVIIKENGYDQRNDGCSKEICKLCEHYTEYGIQSSTGCDVLPVCGLQIKNYS